MFLLVAVLGYLLFLLSEKLVYILSPLNQKGLRGSFTPNPTLLLLTSMLVTGNPDAASMAVTQPAGD